MFYAVVMRLYFISFVINRTYGLNQFQIVGSELENYEIIKVFAYENGTHLYIDIIDT